MTELNRHDALATRLVLAQLTDDASGWEITVDDIGYCPHCWQEVASHLASVAAECITQRWGHNDAIATTQRIIAKALDADQDCHD
jgi:hypothetical protein